MGHSKFNTDWRDRETTTFAQIVNDLIQSEFYERAQSKNPVMVHWECTMKQHLAKNIAAKKVVEWDEILNECPDEWESSIMYWLTKETIFKNGKFIRQIEEMGETERVKSLLNDLFLRGSRNIARLPGRIFNWWWGRVSTKIQTSILHCMNYGQNHGDDDCDFTSIPLINLDKMIESWLTNMDLRYHGPESFKPHILLRVFEVAMKKSLPRSEVITFHDILNTPKFQNRMTASQKSKFIALKTKFAKDYNVSAQ